MTSAQVVETSVNVILNRLSKDNTHPDDRTLLNYNLTPGFKPFTISGLRTCAYHFRFYLLLISTANQNTSLSWYQPELSICGAGQVDRSSWNENGWQ